VLLAKRHELFLVDPEEQERFALELVKEVAKNVWGVQKETDVAEDTAFL
jgi:hypothetical protein